MRQITHPRGRAGAHLCVMKHTIAPTPQGLHITASVAAGKREALLDELGKCAAGTCSCPSTQYAKLQAIEVSPQAEGVTVELTAKAGETIDAQDIARCLDHTARQVGA